MTRKFYWKLNLDDFSVEPCSMEEWSNGNQLSYKVAATTLTDWNVYISTVFLGIDHQFYEDGPPHIFETMVFAEHFPDMDQTCERYSTYEEALSGHNKVVEIVEAWLMHNNTLEGWADDTSTAALVARNDDR